MASAREIANGLGGYRSGTGFVCRCPAHDDRSPSLSVRELNGKLLVHCFGGCPQAAVIAALQVCRLWPSGQEPRNLKPVVRLPPRRSETDDHQRIARALQFGAKPRIHEARSQRAISTAASSHSTMISPAPSCGSTRSVHLVMTKRATRSFDHASSLSSVTSGTIAPRRSIASRWRRTDAVISERKCSGPQPVQRSSWTPTKSDDRARRLRRPRNRDERPRCGLAAGLGARQCDRNPRLSRSCPGSRL